MNVAEALNLGCFCKTLDKQRLQQQLETDATLSGMAQVINQTRPHLFSSTVVFLSSPVAKQIAHTVATLERVMSLAPYTSLTLTKAPAIAQNNFGPVSAFMGYDFHLGPQGLSLIEVNTNAGGALLNAALLRAQQSCCEAMDWAFQPDSNRSNLENVFFEMFESEWRSQRGDRPLKSVVIVDDDPAHQYLAPEFELCRHMFQQRGVNARIADPTELHWHNGELICHDEVVDLVYNRLTDFYLSEPGHMALRQAYEAGAVVMTPHPRAHALQADKRNLVTLSDPDLLKSWDVSEADCKVIAQVVPTTKLLTPENADALWAQRRQWFFKPATGYGAKAVYRGDKLTKRVWSEIQQGEFIAQTLVPPSERIIETDGVFTDLKFDVRAYTYAGQVQLLAARMYNGQTTNFRTPGGGFAPILVVD